MEGGDGEGAAQVPDAEKPVEATTVTDDVRIEVDILALTAAGRITATIADRIVAFKPDIVLIGSENLSATARAFAAFRERAEQLIKALDSLPTDAKPAGEAAATESSLAALDFVKTVANLMSYFKAETNYFGRKVELSEAAIYPLMAGHLQARSIDVILPEIVAPSFDSPAPGFSVFGMIDALITRRNRLNRQHGGEPPLHIAATLATVDAVIDGALKPDPLTGNTNIAQLLLGSDICRLVAEAKKPLLVSLKSIVAGGHVRTRRHLFTTIFTGDKISFSAGAAVGYFIFELKTSKILGGDVLSESKTMKGDWANSIVDRLA
ncbi:hypothetical protein [Rhizobium leguminosarum]|uniref:hypothetical protein n=1 Tax=Rhizobium leguminosarum TaxID=384 RepID=UPI001F16211F|nr:hypothetical protein [Rhizobium leguminosarum]UIK19518.1 hypothetical protein LZK79_11090 [Rhizobium leguminosarum]